MQFAAVWIKLEGIMLSEVSQWKGTEEQTQNDLKCGI